MSVHGFTKLRPPSWPPSPPPPAPPSWRRLEAAIKPHTSSLVAYDASALDKGPKAKIREAILSQLSLSPIRPARIDDASPCQLISGPYCILEDPDLKSFILGLFSSIAESTTIKISRYDLFHCHVFLAPNGCLGLLYHAREYPAFHPLAFPFYLGRCQESSDTSFSAHDRNLLWLAGSIFALDASEDSLIREHIVWPEVEELGTVFEGDLGLPLLDLTLDLNPSISSSLSSLSSCYTSVDVMVSGWPLLSSSIDQG